MTATIIVLVALGAALLGAGAAGAVLSRRHIRTLRQLSDLVTDRRQAVLAEGGTDLFMAPDRFTVSPFPDGDDRRRYWRVVIERRRDGLWAVTDGYDGSGAQHLTAAGQWEWPSGHDDVPGAFWHPWDVALALACRAVLDVEVNGVSVAEAIRRRPVQMAKD